MDMFPCSLKLLGERIQNIDAVTVAQGGIGISSDGDDQMGAKKQDPKKSVGRSLKKIPGPKLKRQKSHVEFLALKILNIKSIRN